MDFPVEIYFIRHGFSCANLVKEKIVKEKKNHLKSLIKSLVRKMFNKDPSLTFYGILSSIVAGQQLIPRICTETGTARDIDMFICSQLRRTWETLYCMFMINNIDITGTEIFPHLTEIYPKLKGLKSTFKRDDNPKSFIKNKRNFNRFLNNAISYNNNQDSAFMWKYLNAIRVNTTFFRKNLQLNNQSTAENIFIDSTNNTPVLTGGGNIVLFLMFLKISLHNKIKQNKIDINKYSERNPFKIVVVSHGGLIRKSIQRFGIPTNRHTIAERFEKNNYTVKLRLNSLQNFFTLDNFSNQSLQSIFTTTEYPFYEGVSLPEGMYAVDTDCQRLCDYFDLKKCVSKSHGSYLDKEISNKYNFIIRQSSQRGGKIKKFGSKHNGLKRNGLKRNGLKRNGLKRTKGKDNKIYYFYNGRRISYKKYILLRKK